MLLKSHQSVPEDHGIHLANVFSYLWPEFHVSENILVQIDAWCDFEQLQSPRDQSEDTAFSDVVHDLSTLTRVSSIEGDLPYMADEFLCRAVILDVQSPILDAYLPALQP